MQDKILEQRCIQLLKRYDTHLNAIIGKPVKMQADLKQGTWRQVSRTLSFDAAINEWGQFDGCGLRMDWRKGMQRMPPVDTIL